MKSESLEKISQLLPARVMEKFTRAADELFPSICFSAIKVATDEGWSLENKPFACPRCGASTKREAVTDLGCSWCVNVKLPWDSLVRLGEYNKPLDQWIIAMKFHRQWHWCDWFGEQLGHDVRSLLDKEKITSTTAGDIVTCVPMHWFRRQVRGFNQSELIASAMAKKLHWPLIPLLHRTRYTKPQSSLTASERAGNISRSFAVKPFDLSNRRIWLVDDVKTTGATLEACARLLRNQGAAEIHIAVVAVGDPTGMHFQMK